jgi:hypothetical protein
MTEYPMPEISEAEVREAVDELNALRDELYLAGYDVPMPARPDEEARIQRLLAAHRLATATDTDRATPEPATSASATSASAPSAPATSASATAGPAGAGLATSGRAASGRSAGPAAPARSEPGRISRRRLFTLAGAVVAAAGAGTAGLIAADQLRPGRAYAATPLPLAIRPVAGDARGRLEQIAGRLAGTGAPAADTPVEHLVTDSWNLDSAVDGHTVTSAVIPSHEQLWRAPDGSALTIEEYLAPQFPSARDRAAWRDDGSPGADRSPRRTPYPAGTFAAAWGDRPPVEPGRLRTWLRRQDTSDTAIPTAITELLHERVLTGPERRALLDVLATEPGLRLLGTTTDRAGRAGLVVAATSSASGGDISHRYVVSPDTGAVLAHESILTGGAEALRVRRPAVISYNTYITAEFVAAIP